MIAAADSGFAYGVGSVWDSLYLERHELITHSFLEHGREEGPTREKADCLPGSPLEWDATLAHLQKGMDAGYRVQIVPQKPLPVPMSVLA